MNVQHKADHLLPPGLSETYKCALTKLLIRLEDSVLQHREFSLGTHRQFDDAFLFRTKYLASEIFSKFVGKDTDSPELRRRRAIDKWLSTEVRNERTNLRMYSACDEAFFNIKGSRVSSEQILDFARRVVLHTIGSEPPDLFGNFSGGASTSKRRGVGVVARKFTEQADVTATAWPFVITDLMLCRGLVEHNSAILSPNIVRGNIMFTVPKNTSIDRVACKEPDLNMWAQKAVGDFIRRRLKREGIDLNDQSVNQNLSRLGSIDGSLATLDLSSASDSVTTGLVSRILPPGWFVCLNALRCEETLIDNEWHSNQMFSSMGNGFTFELESLIFWALSRAVAYFGGYRGSISVYGDDIIVPASMAKPLISVLGWCGFMANKKKTFFKGPFRESCGAHWYAGYCVKPFYLRRPLVNQIDLIHQLNLLRGWLDNDPLFGAPEIKLLYGVDFMSFFERWSKFVERRFWGGRYLDRTDKLVTRHKPSGWSLVLRESRSPKLTSQLGSGLYLHTLRLMSSRGENAVSESQYTLSRVSAHAVARHRSIDYWTLVHPSPRW